MTKTIGYYSAISIILYFLSYIISPLVVLSPLLTTVDLIETLGLRVITSIDFRIVILASFSLVGLSLGAVLPIKDIRNKTFIVGVKPFSIRLCLIFLLLTLIVIRLLTPAGYILFYSPYIYTLVTATSAILGLLIIMLGRLRLIELFTLILPSVFILLSFGIRLPLAQVMLSLAFVYRKHMVKFPYFAAIVLAIVFSASFVAITRFSNFDYSNHTAIIAHAAGELIITSLTLGNYFSVADSHSWTGSTVLTLISDSLKHLFTSESTATSISLMVDYTGIAPVGGIHFFISIYHYFGIFGGSLICLILMSSIAYLTRYLLSMSHEPLISIQTILLYVFVASAFVTLPRMYLYFFIVNIIGLLRYVIILLILTTLLSILTPSRKSTIFRGCK